MDRRFFESTPLSNLGIEWTIETSPLYYASLCEFHNLVEHLIFICPQHVNAISSDVFLYTTICGIGGESHPNFAVTLSVRCKCSRNNPQAVSFVQRCDANKRVDLHIECGERVMARKECKERGGRARLECVYLYLFVGSHYYYNWGGAGSYVLRGNSLIARELDQIASTMK